MKNRIRKIMAVLLTLTLMSADVGTIAESIIHTLTLPKALQIIEEEAFYGDTSIGKVVVPDGTTEIRSRAFAESSLTEIELPVSLSFIADNAFENCNDFDIVAEKGSYAYEWAVEMGYVVDDGNSSLEYEYEIINSQYVKIIGYTGDDTCINVPSTIEGLPVKEIGYGAFTILNTPNYNIESIVLPDGIVTIGKQAFSNCINLSTIVLPEGLETIGMYAFRGCTALKSIDLPDSITDISMDAFINCDGLESIVLPRGLTTVEAGCFEGCDNLSSVIFTGNIRTINSSAFRSCKSLVSIEIPEGVTNIYNGAFEHCKSLASVRLPESLETIAINAFTNCSSQLVITVEENSYAHNWCISNNVNYILSTSIPTMNPTITPSVTPTITPNVTPTVAPTSNPDATSIPESEHPYLDNFDCTWSYDAGEDTENVTITFSADTETEKDCDFIYLYTLDDVQVGEYSGTELAGQSVTIDGTGFKLRLTSDEAWGDGNTYYGFKLDSIVPKKAVPLAFESITAESSAVNAGEIIRWTVVTTGGKAPVTYDYTVMLGGEEVATGTVEAPNVIEYTPVRVGKYNLSVIARDSADVELPAQVSEVVTVAPSTAYPESDHPYTANTDQSWVYAAEENVESLTVTFSEETKTESGYDYIWLYDQNGTRVGKYSGSELSGISIEIPGNAFTIRLTSDGSVQYYGFSIAEIIEYVPGPLQFISMEADKSSAQIGEIITWTINTEGGHVPVTYEYTIARNDEIVEHGFVVRPEAIEYVPMECGDYTISIMTMDADGNTLPVQTSSIAVREKSTTSENDFVVEETSEGIGTLVSYIGSDNVVIIPNTISGVEIEAIADGAFESNLQLESVILPDSLHSIGSYAFYGCVNLKNICLNDGLDIIYRQAFEKCENLEKVYIPDSVTTISYHAFYDCKKLSVINYPIGWIRTLNRENMTGSADRGMYGGIFANTAIKSIYIPSGATIPFTAFKGCDGIENIEIDVGVKVSGSFQFEGCGFESINIPSDWTAISHGMFFNCSNLKEITLPEKIESIGPYAFSGSYLSHIVLNEGLQSIGTAAFSGCSFESIYLPDSIHTIGARAFKNCSNLSTVNYPLGWETVDNYSQTGEVFKGTSIKTIDIPEGVVSIPSYVFYGCTNFTHFELPYSLQSIPAYAFAGCTNLEKIWISESIKPQYDEEGNQTSFVPIASTAFNNVSTGTLTIHGVSGSYAETFAAEKGYAFVAEPFEYTPATLTGFVTDAAGNPLSGVTVTVYKGPTTNYPFGTTTTDSTGAWTMENVKVGSYYGVGFDMEGYSFAPSHVTLTIEDGINRLNDVVGYLGELIEHTASGKVVNENNEAIPFVTVKIIKGSSGEAVGMVKTGYDGRWIVSGLQPNTTYYVGYSMDGYASRQQEYPFTTIKQKTVLDDVVLVPNLAFSASAGTVNGLHSEYYGGYGMEIRVTSDARWTVESDSTWMKPNRDSGDTGEVFFMIVEPNEDYRERVGIVTIKCGEHPPIQIKVTQAGIPLEAGIYIDPISKDNVDNTSAVVNGLLVWGENESVSDYQSYGVQYGIQGEGWIATIPATVDAATGKLSATVNNLQTGMPYTFRTVAQNVSTGEWLTSNENTVYIEAQCDHIWGQTYYAYDEAVADYLERDKTQKRFQVMKTVFLKDFATEESHYIRHPYIQVCELCDAYRVSNVPAESQHTFQTITQTEYKNQTANTHDVYDVTYTRCTSAIEGDTCGYISECQSLLVASGEQHRYINGACPCGSRSVAWEMSFANNETTDIQIKVKSGEPVPGSNYKLIAVSTEGIRYSTMLYADSTPYSVGISTLKTPRAQKYRFYVLPEERELSAENMENYFVYEGYVPLYRGNMITSVYSDGKNVTADRVVYPGKKLVINWNGSFGVDNMRINVTVDGNSVYDQTFKNEGPGTVEISGSEIASTNAKVIVTATVATKNPDMANNSATSKWPGIVLASSGSTDANGDYAVSYYTLKNGNKRSAVDGIVNVTLEEEKLTIFASDGKNWVQPSQDDSDYYFKIIQDTNVLEFDDNGLGNRSFWMNTIGTGTAKVEIWKKEPDVRVIALVVNVARSVPEIQLKYKDLSGKEYIIKQSGPPVSGNAFITLPSITTSHSHLTLEPILTDQYSNPLDIDSKSVYWRVICNDSKKSIEVKDNKFISRWDDKGTDSNGITRYSCSAYSSLDDSMIANLAFEVTRTQAIQSRFQLVMIDYGDITGICQSDKARVELCNSLGKTPYACFSVIDTMTGDIIDPDRKFGDAYTIKITENRIDVMNFYLTVEEDNDRKKYTFGEKIRLNQFHNIGIFDGAEASFSHYHTIKLWWNGQLIDTYKIETSIYNRDARDPVQDLEAFKKNLSEAINSIGNTLVGGAAAVGYVMFDGIYYQVTTDATTGERIFNVLETAAGIAATIGAVQKDIIVDSTQVLLFEDTAEARERISFIYDVFDTTTAFKDGISYGGIRSVGELGKNTFETYTGVQIKVDERVEMINKGYDGYNVIVDFTKTGGPVFK